MDWAKLERELNEAATGLLESAGEVSLPELAEQAGCRVLADLWRSEAQTSAGVDSAARAYAAGEMPWQVAEELGGTARLWLACRLKLAHRFCRGLARCAPEQPLEWFPKALASLPRESLIEWLLVDAWHSFAGQWVDEIGRWWLAGYPFRQTSHALAMPGHLVPESDHFPI